MKWHRLLGKRSLLPRCRFSTSVQQPTLRPYQENCITACLDALRAGSTRIGVSLPTGSGKTVVFIKLLSRLAPISSQATRSLVIVNNIELARQSADQVAILLPNWSVEIEQGAKHRASGLADVTIATYQTLLQPDRLAKFSPSSLKAIIVDEAHHAAAPSYRHLLSHFDNGIKNPDSNFCPPDIPHKIPIIGFSATFSRHDGLALGSVFEEIVYHRDFLEMMKENWLCGIRFTSVKVQIDLSSVPLNAAGDFNSRSLGNIVNTESMNKLVVRTWLDRAADKKSTVIFCVNVAHAIALTQTFREFGIDARYLHAKTPAAERQALIHAFRLGQFPVLVNCAILTEGTDIPNIDCILLVRPTRSRNLFAQMIGRGMRLSPATGKQDCRVIDFVEGSEHASGVVSFPTLFGLDPASIDMQDETMESVEKLVKEQGVRNLQLAIPDPKSVTYTDFEDPFSWVDESSGAPHVAKLSPLTWVGCGEDVYVLECMGKGHVRIERSPPGSSDPNAAFTAYYTPTALDRLTAAELKVSPYFRSRKLLTSRTLSDALHGCDTFVTSKIVLGPMKKGLLRVAPWRKRPASPQQLQFIAKRWGSRNPKVYSEDANNTDPQWNNLTKGAAANIITRLRHGAQARYEKKQKAIAKVVDAAEKERSRVQREVVRLGKLN